MNTAMFVINGTSDRELDAELVYAVMMESLESYVTRFSDLFEQLKDNVEILTELEDDGTLDVYRVALSLLQDARETPFREV
jgi:hypothetical protein